MPFSCIFLCRRRAAGKCRGKKWTPFFSEEIDKERGRGGGKSLRESPHTGLQHPHHPPMPHLITHMKREKKAAAAAGPRSLSLFFPSARRAAPHRAWDDLLCLAQPPFFRVGGGKSRGSWGRTSGFSACRRAATCPETAGSPPTRTWTRDDGLLQGCNLGCHDAEMLQPLLF